MSLCSFFFFLNDPAPTEIYPLSLHDALPISHRAAKSRPDPFGLRGSLPPLAAGSRSSCFGRAKEEAEEDRKSTRLNSSHGYISYAVFCLKKKKIHNIRTDGTETYATHIPTEA